MVNSIQMYPSAAGWWTKTHLVCGCTQPWVHLTLILRKWRETSSEQTLPGQHSYPKEHIHFKLWMVGQNHCLLLCDLRIQLHSMHQKWVSYNQSSVFLSMEMGCELSWELTSQWQVREDKIWNNFCKTLSSSLAIELGSVTLERPSGLSSHPEESLLWLRICWNSERP